MPICEPLEIPVFIGDMWFFVADSIHTQFAVYTRSLRLDVTAVAVLATIVYTLWFIYYRQIRHGRKMVELVSSFELRCTFALT